MSELIRITGARENDLKNVSLTIPERGITVFTGVSGAAPPGGLLRLTFPYALTSENVTHPQMVLM